MREFLEVMWTFIVMAHVPSFDLNVHWSGFTYYEKGLC